MERWTSDLHGDAEIDIVHLPLHLRDQLTGFRDIVAAAYIGLIQ